MKDVDQLDVSKADQEAQQSAVVPWNMSEIRGSGERGCPGCTRLVSAPYLYPAASIWNRATSERGESHQKVTVQLQRIKETTQMINQFQEGGGNSYLLLLSQQKHKTQTNHGLGVLPVQHTT